MKHRMIRTGFYLALLFYPVSGIAAKRALQVQDKAFILKPVGKPAQVTEYRSSTLTPGTFMRMPDLSGKQQGLLSSAHHEASRDAASASGGREHGASSHGKVSKGGGTDHFVRHETGKQEHGQIAEHDVEGSSLTFKKVVISGKVRLPRIKFARVGISMELRDEEHSLDFNQKTLRDSGY